MKFILLIILIFTFSSCSKTIYQEKDFYFNTMKLKELLNKEYQKYMFFEKKTYKNKNIKYYNGTYMEAYRRSTFESLKFINEISFDKAQEVYIYDKVIYENQNPVEVITIDKNNKIIQKGYFDKKGRIIKTYNIPYNIITLNKLNGNDSIYTIHCDNNVKECCIRYMTYKEDSDSYFEHVQIYSEFPSKMLMPYQYNLLIKKKILEKESKNIFDGILREENNTTEMEVKYFLNYKIEGKRKYTIKFIDQIEAKKNNYFKVYFKNNKPFKAKEFNILNSEKPIKIIKLDLESRLTQIIDFKNREISSYNYSINSINKITCKYREGTCCIIQL